MLTIKELSPTYVPATGDNLKIRAVVEMDAKDYTAFLEAKVEQEEGEPVDLIDEIEVDEEQLAAIEDMVSEGEGSGGGGG